MNQYISISIARVAFKVEVQGYNLLNDYLEQIKKAYANNPDGAEILSDIEARIAELMLSKTPEGHAASTATIQEIITQLGMPDSEASESKDTPPQTFARRLYRNPENGRIGNVCSGIATYFDTDPVIVRILWLLPLLILIGTSSIDCCEWIQEFSSSLVVISFCSYLLLWIAIPVARTPRQKLEMHGQRITTATIEHSISQSSASTKSNNANPKATDIFSEILCIIGRILFFIAKVALVFIGLIMVLATITVLVATCIFLSNMSTFLALIGGSSMVGLPLGGYIAIGLLIILLPMVGLSALFFEWTASIKINRTFLRILAVVWLLLSTLFIYSTIRNVNTIPQHYKSVKELWTGEDFISVDIINDSISIKTFSQDDLVLPNAATPQESQADSSYRQSDSK